MRRYFDTVKTLTKIANDKFFVVIQMFLSCCLYNLSSLLYHTFWILSRGFLNFFENFFEVFGWPLSLDCDNSILQANRKSNRQVAQSSGKKIVQLAYWQIGRKNGIMKIYAKIAAPRPCAARRKRLPPRGT